MRIYARKLGAAAIALLLPLSVPGPLSAPAQAAAPVAVSKAPVERGIDPVAALAGRRFSATRSAGAGLSVDDTAVMAETAARHAALRTVIRALVVLPEVRIAGTSAPTAAKTPNLLALALATTKISVLLISKSRKAAAVTVTVVIDDAGDSPPLEKRVRETLTHSERLALYENVVLREKRLLDAFDALVENYGKQVRHALSDASLPQSAEGIVKEIRALRMFTALLPSRNGLWKNPEAVHAAMGEALELAPGSALCRNAMGDALLQMGRSQEALEQQTLALRYTPSFARAYHSRGAAALAMGLYSSAIADFTEAIRLNPLDPAHYRARGMAGHLAGETAAMCRDLHQACRLGECGEFHWAVSAALCDPSGQPVGIRP